MLSRYLLPHWFIDGWYFKDSTYQCKTVKRYIIVGESPVSWQCYLCTRRRVIRILILSLDVESDWRNNCWWFLHSDVSEVKVLVPGAGLGRLAWEIACLGYSCQGNEWSFFMLFSSNFVLNRYKNVTKHTFSFWKPDRKSVQKCRQVIRRGVDTSRRYSELNSWLCQIAWMCKM